MINQADLIAQIINFIILMGLLYWLLYKPVRAFMDQRTEEIEEQIRSAEKNQAAAEVLRAELEKQTSESRQQARQFLDEAAKRAEALQTEMLAQARKEAEGVVSRAQEIAKLETEKAWAGLKTEVGELSLLLASKIISDSLDQEQHQYLIDETLQQLGSTRKGNGQ